MYLQDIELTVTWPIRSLTSNTIIKSLFYVLVVSPNGLSTYYVDPTVSFTAPTISTLGSTSYVFTPSIQGVWSVLLVTGIQSSYALVASCEVPVRSTEDVSQDSLAAVDATVKVLPTEVYRVKYVPAEIVAYQGAINTATINRRAFNNVAI